MRLSDLDAQFLKREDSRHFNFVAMIAEADGIEFLCPKCFVANNGKIGTHGVICWAPTVPQDTSPTPGRWELQGTSIEDLTLVAGSSSIQLNGGCNAHFYIRNGAAVDIT